MHQPLRFLEKPPPFLLLIANPPSLSLSLALPPFYRTRYPIYLFQLGLSPLEEKTFCFCTSVTSHEDPQIRSDFQPSRLVLETTRPVCERTGIYLASAKLAARRKISLRSKACSNARKFQGSSSAERSKIPLAGSVFQAARRRLSALACESLANEEHRLSALCSSFGKFVVRSK